MEIPKTHLVEAHQLLEQFLSNEANLKSIEQGGDMLVDAIKNGNRIYACGNGGSMCDAMHFAEEMVGKFRNERRALPAVAISDSGYLSCASNDIGYEYVFSRYLEAFAQPGDVLLGISTSGNSRNILNAIEVASKNNVKVIGLTGKDGGEMAELSDIEVRAPNSQYADRAQELHIKIIHIFIDYVEQKLGMVPQT
jgi:D-sedoheptulose 7-phosphate isomerase